MDEAAYQETLRELDRQIELTEEFLRQRKQHARYDTDLVSKLRELRDERERLLQSVPLKDVSEDFLVGEPRR